MDKNYEQCKSCKYFLEHYVKARTSFHTLSEGHCIYGGYPSQKKYKLSENCKFYESNEEVKKERKESVKKTIREIKDTLKQIEKILQDDL